MKSIGKIILVVTMMFVSVSCEKTFNTVLDVDIPHTPIIALECIQVADATYASITATVSVTGTITPKSINDAKAVLYENNVQIDTFKFFNEQGYKCAFTNFNPGKNYKVVASAASYQTVDAEDRCPYPIEIVKTEFKKEAKTIIVPDFGNTPQLFDEFKITFKNHADIKDYYEFNVYTTGTVGGQNYFIISNDIDIDPNDEGDILNGNVSMVYPPFTMGDANFNGQDKTLIFYALSANTDQLHSFWNISISHLSESYYKFQKTRRLYESTENNPFAEPVQIFSNVKNGIGIFALKKDTVLAF